MLYAKIENNTVLEIFDLKTKYSNVSFPLQGPNAQWLQEENLLPISVNKPHNRLIEKTVATDPYIENDMVYTVHIVPLTTEEIETSTNSEWQKIRAIRNRLLEESDWTALVDTPFSIEKKAQWQEYRQALRDVPTQNSPYEIIWPTKPT
jgi:hypothetical protein